MSDELLRRLTPLTVLWFILGVGCYQIIGAAVYLDPLVDIRVRILMGMFALIGMPAWYFMIKTIITWKPKTEKEEQKQW